MLCLKKDTCIMTRGWTAYKVYNKKTMRGNMEISYQKFWKLLIDYESTKSQLKDKAKSVQALLRSPGEMSVLQWMY